MRKLNWKVIVACLGIAVIAYSCKSNKRKKRLENFKYEAFKDSLSIENYDASHDTANIFDTKVFTPGVDSFENLLVRVDTLWHLEEEMIEKQSVMKKISRTEESYTLEDKKVVTENVKVLDSFLVNRNNILPAACSEMECLLYVKVVKSTQKLYLYIEGDLKDSFKVSTGIKNYETPNMNLRPAGPVFTKYNSKKFPGGNYLGLGNMPYAVFLKGGYAIHGTTKGNFVNLGTRASHGCIRLHPNNAKMLNELIKRIGLENIWVTIVD